MASETRIPWIETPLVKSANLSRIAGCNVFLKLENLQPSGSFKSRGIGSFMVAKLKELRASSNDSSLNAHFYISSGGNAGLGCVHAANTLGCRATVVVPLTTTEFMVAKLRQAGATEVIQEGASWQEADGYLNETLIVEARARGEAPVYVPAFDAQEIWDGNAGITKEVARQICDAAKHYPITDTTFTNGVADASYAAPKVDVIICSVGGGGLFSGIMQGIDELQLRSSTKVIAIETLGADSLSQAVAKRELVTLPAITSLATSLGARRVCKRAFEYGLQENVATLVLTDAEAIRGCRRFADEEHYLVELACGVCPALIYNGQLRKMIPEFHEGMNVVMVVCGGSNMTFDIMEKYVADLA